MGISSTTPILEALRKARVAEIAAYQRKLTSNAVTPTVHRDLVTEACAALTFASAGFDVEMRDSPDLHLAMSNEILFAEVKHFRRKAQDDLDDGRLRNAGGQIVQYGDTTALEGLAATEQIVQMATKKVGQFCAGSPNVLVLESSSTNCVEDTEVDDAVQRISELTSERAGLSKLNGILFLSPSFSCRLHTRVHFFETDAAVIPLTGRIRKALRAISSWPFKLAST